VRVPKCRQFREQSDLASSKLDSQYSQFAFGLLDTEPAHPLRDRAVPLLMGQGHPLPSAPAPVASQANGYGHRHLHPALTLLPVQYLLRFLQADGEQNFGRAER